ncbi:MAG: hypothetical protein JXA91_04510 [Candidatus Thermoplasmatota archaeon]|nr:hypothetical protein [Candidatus Thermoplasmatota archaeon]
MGSKLNELEDGVLVEAEFFSNQMQQISGNFSRKVDTAIESIKPILMRISKPVIEACKEMDKESMVEQAEIEVGFGFEGEGNIYITKSKVGANLNIKMIIKLNK